MTNWDARNINKRFAPRTAHSGLGVYPLEKSQVSGFFRDLWSETFIEKIANWMYGDPMDSIIGLRWYYGIKNTIPRSAKEAYVSLGSQAFKGGFGTGDAIITRPAISEYTHVDCGYINVPQKYKDFRDLAPYTQLELYIPFVGNVNLNANDFVPQTDSGWNRLHLQYNINIVTGAATAIVSRGISPFGSSPRPEQIIYDLSGMSG